MSCECYVAVLESLIMYNTNLTQNHLSEILKIKLKIYIHHFFYKSIQIFDRFTIAIPHLKHVSVD